ncbi:cytochrome P450 [Blastocladiella britannica]|nr:cytochrome P450 [Blastocladiella britannica]
MYLPSSTFLFEQIEHLRDLVPQQLVDAVDRALTTVPTAAVVVAVPTIFLVAKYTAAQIRNWRNRRYLAIVDPKTGKRSAVSGPPTSLLQILTIGQVPEILAQPSLVAYQSHLMAEYGPIWRSIYFTGAQWSYDFGVMDESKDVLILLSGPRGRRAPGHRRLINLVFNLKVLKSLLPVMQSTYSELEQVIRSSNGTTIDIYPLSVKVTLNVLGRTALDTEFGAFSDRVHVIHWAYARLVAVFSMNLFYTLWRGVPGFRYLPLPGNIALAKARKIAFGRSDRPSLVAALFDKLSKNTASDTFTFENVQNELLTFLSAGHKTTSIVHSMTTYYLARHPEVQAKPLRELNGIDPEEYSQSTYLTWVINESLRMHSHAYATGRKAKCDMSLPLSDGSSLQAPKNIMLFAPIQAIHRSTAIYGPDANTLRVATTVADIPSEEEQAATGIKMLHPYQYFPFNAGPRACIGRQFVLMEIRLLVASLSIGDRRARDQVWYYGVPRCAASSLHSSRSSI